MPGTDRRAWSSSIVIGGAFLVAFTAHTLLGMHLHDLIPRWPISADTWMATGVAQSIIHGHPSQLYTYGGYDALPLWPMVLTPVVALANALGLSGTRGIDPSLAQLVLPYSLAVGVFVLHSGRSLAWALGTRSRLWMLAPPTLVTLWSFQGSSSDPVWWAGLVILLGWASLPILRTPPTKEAVPGDRAVSLARAAA